MVTVGASTLPIVPSGPPRSVQNQDKFLAEMEVASVYAGKRMAPQVGKAMNKRTIRIVDGVS